MTDPSPAALIELASRPYRVAGSPETAVAEELGWSITKFWLEVPRLLNNPPADVAVAWGPQLNRLRRLREVEAAAKEPRIARRSPNRCRTPRLVWNT